MKKLMELTPDGELVIAALTPGIGGMIRRDCEAELLAMTGAACLKTVIRLPTEALQLRRLQ